MSRNEKIRYLMAHYRRRWEEAQYDMWDKLSSERKRKCICGKPSDGDHFGTCRAFSKKVDNLAIEQLEHLLPSKNNGQELRRGVRLP